MPASHSPSAESILKALSDRTRLRIIALLHQADELCVCDLQTILDTPQPKISRHLKVLRDEAMVSDRRDGTWIHYRLNSELPLWATQLISAAVNGSTESEPFRSDRESINDLTAGAACGQK